MNGKMIFAGLVAIIMVACTVPFMASEDTDALVGNVNMAMNTDHATVYVNSTTDHSATFTASVTDNSLVSQSDFRWKLNPIGDGSQNVSFSDDDNNLTYTASGTTSVTIYGKIPGSIELEVYIQGDEINHRASAVIVVYNSPGTPATEFHFWFQVYNSPNNKTPVANTLVEQYGNDAIYNNLSSWNTGFWVTVTNTQVATQFNTTDFNAKLALDYIVATHSGWNVTYSSYGWIDTFMGLGTYQSGTTYYYWAQYHNPTCSGSWDFNNQTLEFITTQDHAYIGMVFWGSPNATQVPPFPTISPTA